MSEIAATLLVLVLALLSVGTAVGQPTVLGYPGYAVDTSYSQPTHLGDSMSLMINVTNLSYYIVASVETLMLTFDWGATLAGPTPRPLEPGQNSTWRFDQVEIPSYTWSGTHVCVISVTVSFSYPTWRLGRILTYQNISIDGEIPLQFKVQALLTSGASTTITGPRLLRVVSNTTVSSNQPGTSPISFVYRVAMVAFVVIAVLLLAMRPHLANRLARTEKSELDQSGMQH